MAKVDARTVSDGPWYWCVVTCRAPFLGAVAAVIMSLAVFGCGSSDSDTDSVACTNNCVPLSGSVADANGAPIQGANVTLQLGSQVYGSATDGQGRYTFEFPTDNLPQFFSAYAYKTGFMPKAILLAYSGGTLFTITSGGNNVQTPATTDRDVVYLKGISLRHLGDDQFSGVQNSQLQIPSEGEYWVDSFVLTAEQKAANSTLTISMLVRGLQCSSVVTNIYQVQQPGDNLVGPGPAQVLGAAPAGGSFGPLTKTFSLAAMQPGEVFLFIRSDPSTAQTVPTLPGSSCSGGDSDDFEFIEVTGRLS